MDTRKGSQAKWGFVWIVLGAAIGMSAGLPPLFLATAGVFMHPLSAEFHWGRTETALAYSSSMLGLTLVSPLVGNLMDRFGVRRVIVASALLFGLCVAGLSLQQGSKTTWVGLSFLIGVFGAATSGLGYLAVLPQQFDRRLGLALGLAMCGLGLGTVVMPVLTQSLIASFGWRTTYAILGFGSMTFAVVAFCMLRERTTVAQASLGEPSGVPVNGSTLAQSIRSWRLWTMFGVFLVASTAINWLFPHVPSLMMDRGFSLAQAAPMTSLMGAGLITGRLGTGILLDRVHAPYLACLFFALGAVGVMLLKGATHYPALLGAGFMLGLAIGAEGDLITYLVKAYFGLRSFGTLYGITFAGYTLGGVVGPIIVGKLFDIDHSYSLALTLSPYMLLAAAIVLMTLGKYRFSVSDRRRMVPTRG
jgi:OFA family oxalate/formate antiporter-like MFS transporter